MCIFAKLCYSKRTIGDFVKIPMFYVNMGQIGKYEFCYTKRTFPNFLGGILLVYYKGYLSRTNLVEKASVAICSVKKQKMPVLIIQ